MSTIITKGIRTELPSMIVFSVNINDLIISKTMTTSNYNYIIGMKSPVGWVYNIQGDSLYALTKKDCEHRIRSLYNSGVIKKSNRDYLLIALKTIKRG